MAREKEKREEIMRKYRCDLLLLSLRYMMVAVLKI